MFRKTSPQLSMLESQFLLPDATRQRLEACWAQTFRTVVLPRHRPPHRLVEVHRGAVLGLCTGSALPHEDA